MFAAPARIASNKETKAQRRWHGARERLTAVCSVYIPMELIFQSRVKMEPPGCNQSHQGPMPGHGAGRAAVAAVDSEPPPARRHRRRGDRPPREPGGADYDGTGRDGRHERRHAGKTARISCGTCGTERTGRASAVREKTGRRTFHPAPPPSPCAARWREAAQANREIVPCGSSAQVA